MIDTTLMKKRSVGTADRYSDLVFTPPMGWNSYDCFGLSVNEAEVRANADYMADYMAAYGWEYIIVDHAWYAPSLDISKSAPIEALCMDDYGRMIPALNRFPSAACGQGFRPLSDYIHGRGLKFGIHIMRGISRQAVENNTPILGSSRRASDIADIDSTCEWCNDNYGIDANRDGAQAWYDSVMALLAEWDIDAVKIDDISFPYSAREIELINNAIAKCGKNIILSLSPGPASLDRISHLKENAHIWRISADFWDRWKDLHSAFDLCASWQGVGQPGSWPHADMLPLGRIGIRQHELNSPDRWTRFTKDEQVTLMSLWCIFRSPLVFGGNLPDNDEWTLSLLTNSEILQIQKSSMCNRELFHRENHVAWTAIGDGGCHYLALFNLGDDIDNVTVTLPEMGVSGEWKLRDLWAHCNLGSAYSSVTAQVQPHGARVFKMTPA